MKKLMFAPLLIVFLMGSGCQNSPEQNLLTLNQDYNTQKTRVLAYASMERCSVTVTIGCADQGVVDVLKADVKDTDAKFDTAWTTKTDGDTAIAEAGVTHLKADLEANHIN